MKITGNFIVDKNNNPVSASDFWEWQKQNSNTLGLKLLGLAKPKLRIAQDNNQLSACVDFVTEIGTLKDLHYVRDLDYIIYKNYWIPLDLNYFNPLNSELKALEIEPREKVSLGKLLRLISNLRDTRIEIIDEVDFRNYKINPIKIEGGNLALPLYEYQKRGIDWLVELSNQQVGGLLCDEMGLGKTVQAFGLIQYSIKNNRNKILVVTPASLVLNWSREIEKFIPGLPHYLHIGPNRLFHPSDLESQNIIIVSYEILTKDFNNFNRINWDLIICDEAQNLKNSDSKRHIAISKLSSLNKFLITGTPIENSLTDLWSLINIVRPGLLGNLRNFQSLVEDHPSDARKLSNFAAPIILRRLVKDVAKDLPKLVTKELILTGTDYFVDFYERRRRELVESKRNTLEALTELIQICCYPGLIDSSYVDSHDVKINELLEILSNVKKNNEKAIIFSTYRKSLDLIFSVISRQLSPNFISIIDGRVNSSRRFDLISSFNDFEGFAILCIQPKAGGTGLNITSANHVIHFNRQWNPAIERQATARAFRRGQKKTVFEYLMSYAGTVEQYISDTLYRKSLLAQYGTEQAEAEGSDKDIKQALQLTPLS